jgi:hypothetical protein
MQDKPTPTPDLTDNELLQRNIMVLGTLFAPQAPTPPMEPPLPPVPVPGFHVNTTFNVAEWADFQVHPSHPRNVFAGVETFFYSFDTEAQFRAAVRAWSEAV